MFVGREREMEELVGALDDALLGQGRLVMLVGEPGIGKTRTAEEFSAYAQRQSALVLWGRCHEQQGMPPFCPGYRPSARTSASGSRSAEKGQSRCFRSVLYFGLTREHIRTRIFRR